MDGPLRPGSVVFVKTPEGVTHRDYVTHAWADRPVREVLAKMAIDALADTGSQPVAAIRQLFADAGPRVETTVISAKDDKGRAGITQCAQKFVRV